MNRTMLVFVIAILALVPIALVSGCIGQAQSGTQTQSNITTPDQAGNAIAGIGDKVQDITTTLNDIESDLK